MAAVTAVRHLHHHPKHHDDQHGHTHHGPRVAGFIDFVERSLGVDLDGDGRIGGAQLSGDLGMVPPGAHRAGPGDYIDTYLHQGDPEIRDHVSAQDRAQLAAYQATQERTRKHARPQESDAGGDTQANQGSAEPDSEGHPVFGQGANFRSADNFLPQLNDDETIAKTGILFKRIQAHKLMWVPRYITLTNRSLYVRNEEGGDIRDVLRLLEITHARQKYSGSFEGNDSLGGLAGEWIGVIEIYQECYGRTYYLRVGDRASEQQAREECEEWIAAIIAARTQAEADYIKSLNLSRQQRMRIFCQKFYDHNITQMLISVLLLANFVISILQSVRLRAQGAVVVRGWGVVG